jgi:hypothetical protein
LENFPWYQHGCWFAQGGKLNPTCNVVSYQVNVFFFQITQKEKKKKGILLYLQLMFGTKFFTKGQAKNKTLLLLLLLAC